MAPLCRRAVSWLLVSIMPFYAMTAVYLDLLGPMHFHLEEEALEHGGGHTHTHAHSHPQRHHHHGSEPRTVTMTDDAEQPLAERMLSGWSSTQCAALLSAPGSPHPPALANRVTASSTPRLQTHLPDPPDRPPPARRA